MAGEERREHLLTEDEECELLMARSYLGSVTQLA